MKILEKIIEFLILNLFIYLILSFIHLNLNFIEWKIIGRLIFSLFFILFLYYSFLQNTDPIEKYIEELQEEINEKDCIIEELKSKQCKN